MNSEILIEKIKEVEATNPPIPIDKEANIRVLLEGWSQKHPVIRDAIEGKTSVTEFLTPFVDDLSGLALFKRVKVKGKYSTELTAFIDEALSVKGYKSCGRASGYYVSITERRIRVPYFSGSLMFLLGLLIAPLVPCVFVDSWLRGLVSLGVWALWMIGTYYTWFEGPFEFTRELVPALRNRAEYLDAVIRRCYPITL